MITCLELQSSTGQMRVRCLGSCRPPHWAAGVHSYIIIWLLCLDFLPSLRRAAIEYDLNWDALESQRGITNNYSRTNEDCPQARGRPHLGDPSSVTFLLGSSQCICILEWLPAILQMRTKVLKRLTFHPCLEKRAENLIWALALSVKVQPDDLANKYLFVMCVHQYTIVECCLYSEHLLGLSCCSHYSDRLTSKWLRACPRGLG